MGRKVLKRVLGAFLGIFAVFSICLAPGVYADTRGNDEPTVTEGGSEDTASGSGDCVKTAIIGGGQYCDTDGSGIYKILNIVVNVLMAGVGVLGTVGIIIAGVQYMTSAGNEAQMAKAKKRIGEVVLGLIVFGVMWTVLQWLLPGGIL